MEPWIAAIVALIGGVTSAKGWEFWQAKRRDRLETEQADKKEIHLYRDDLKKEVARLRTELVELYEKRDKEMKKLSSQLADLKASLATFKTRVEFLEKTEIELRERIKELTENQG